MELLKTETAKVKERLSQYEAVLTGGEPDRGRTLFFSRSPACSTCHRIQAEGGRVGPDLTRIGAARSVRDLLESVIVPSSTFAQGYESWMVVVRDGRVLGGILARQTPEAIVLRSGSGADVQVRREEIQSMEREETSLMPDGLERAMTREELRDLIAYLLSLK